MISLFAKYKERIVQLPVNPEDITISGKSGNIVSNTVGQGEINEKARQNRSVCGIANGKLDSQNGGKCFEFQRCRETKNHKRD